MHQALWGPTGNIMVPDDQGLAACYDHPPHAVGIALWNTTVWSIMNSTLQLICLGAVCLSRLHFARVLFSKSASSRWASRFAATESSCTLHYVHSQQAAFCTCGILMSKLDSLCSIFADRLFETSLWMLEGHWNTQSAVMSYIHGVDTFHAT